MPATHASNISKHVAGCRKATTVNLSEQIRSPVEKSRRHQQKDDFLTTPHHYANCALRPYANAISKLLFCQRGFPPSRNCHLTQCRTSPKANVRILAASACRWAGHYCQRCKLDHGSLLPICCGSRKPVPAPNEVMLCVSDGVHRKTAEFNQCMPLKSRCLIRMSSAALRLTLLPHRLI